MGDLAESYSNYIPHGIIHTQLVEGQYPLLSQNILIVPSLASTYKLYFETTEVFEDADELKLLTTYYTQTGHPFGDSIKVIECEEHYIWTDVSGQHLLTSKTTTYDYFDDSSPTQVAIVRKELAVSYQNGEQAIFEEFKLKDRVIIQLLQKVETDLGKDARKKFSEILTGEISAYRVNREFLMDGINGLNNGMIMGVVPFIPSYVALTNKPY